MLFWGRRTGKCKDLESSRDEEGAGKRERPHCRFFSQILIFIISAPFLDLKSLPSPFFLSVCFPQAYLFPK